MIGANRKVTHAQVLEPFGLYVEIDQHLLVRVQTTLLAAVDTILLAFLFAVVVEVAAVGNRYRFIGFFDTALHLVIEGALQCLGVGQHCFGIFIFGFQIGQYSRVVALSQPVVSDRRVRRRGSRCVTGWIAATGGGRSACGLDTATDTSVLSDIGIPQ